MNAVEKIDSWANTSFKADPRSLAISRILFAMFALLNFPSYHWLADLPGTFFLPPFSLAIMFTSFPPAAVVHAFDFASIALLVLVAFGLFTRTASVALALTWIIANSFAFSVGKIDHTILGVLVPLVGAAAGWGNRYSVDSLRGQQGNGVQFWPLSIFAVAIAFTMLTAALPKIESGWLDPEASAARGHMFRYFYALDRQLPLAEWMLGIESKLFWEAQDWFTIAFEGGFIFFAWNIRAFRFFCLVALVFHLGVFFTMDIFFADNMLAYGLFVPWRKLFPARINVTLPRLNWIALTAVAVVASVSLATALVQFGQPVPEWVEPWGMILLAAVVVVFFGLKMFGPVVWPEKAMRGRTAPRPVS